MSNERLSGKPDAPTHTEARWGGRVFRKQIPEQSEHRGLKQLGKSPDGNGQSLVDLSMAPSLISGITRDEIDTLSEASSIPPEYSLPEGGYSEVGPDYLSRVDRANRAEEGY